MIMYEINTCLNNEQLSSHLNINKQQINNNQQDEAQIMASQCDTTLKLSSQVDGADS